MNASNRPATWLFMGVITVSMAVAGCSHARRTERAELAQRAQLELVGLSKTEVLTCAGVPVRSTTEGEMEFLTYATSSRGWRGSCQVTFVLKEGIVQQVSYSGRTGSGGQKGEQCAYAVENCLASVAD